MGARISDGARNDCYSVAENGDGMNLIRKTIRRFCVICRRSLSGRRWVRPTTKTCSTRCNKQYQKLVLRRRSKRVRQKFYHRRLCEFCKGPITPLPRTRTKRFCSNKCSRMCREAS